MSVVGTIRRIEDPGALTEIGRAWRALEAHAECSFFLSWGWIGPWARLILGQAPLYLFRCELAGETVGLAFLSCRRVTLGRGLIRATQLQLHQFDAAQFDMTMEYNGILCARGSEAACWESLAAQLGHFPARWDELVLRSLSGDQLASARAALRSLREEPDRGLPSWSVALSPEHADEEKLLAIFKKKTRQQMRQTVREFEAVGAVAFDLASTVDEALVFFAAMGELHGVRWERVGKSGSFANDNWTAFHRAVIIDGFARGEVLISRVRVAGDPVGFVYAFRRGERLYALQTGFKPHERPALRSGYLTHLRTMQAAAAAGITRYDLLPDGGGSYKRLLAEPEGEFTTTRFQKVRIRFWFLRLARRAWVKLKTRAEPTHHPAHERDPETPA